MLLDRLQAKKPGSMPGRERAIESVSSQGDGETSAPASEIKKVVNGSVITLEGTYLGRPIRVRIFGEPAHEPALATKE